MQFDQHLVRRFTQLLGIYPPGNLVRLDNGALARGDGACTRRIRIKPRVKVIVDSRRRAARDALRYQPVGSQRGQRRARRPSAPLDPAEYGIDPLTYL